jgi:hypothetical protein
MTLAASNGLPGLHRVAVWFNDPGNWWGPSGQLGQLFIAGNNVDSLTPIALGLIFFIALALALDFAILGAAAALSPWHRAVR